MRSGKLVLGPDTKTALTEEEPHSYIPFRVLIHYLPPHPRISFISSGPTVTKVRILVVLNIEPRAYNLN
jgi:hypothetical protein